MTVMILWQLTDWLLPAGRRAALLQIADWNSIAMRHKPMVLAQPICKLL
jgi:hypothetical protein